MSLKLFRALYKPAGYLFGAIAAASFTLPAEAAQLVRWKLGTEQTPLEFVTDVPVTPQAQLMFGPPRIVIDLPGVELNRPTVKQRGQGAVKQIRIGQLNANTIRLVVELDAKRILDPTQIRIRGLSQTQWVVEVADKTFPNVAEIELSPPTEVLEEEIVSFSDSARDSIGLETAPASQDEGERPESILVTPPPYPFPQQPTAPTTSFPSPNPSRSPLVIIDAGHGGPDPGAIGRNALRETDITLDISQQVSRYLNEMGISTQMTRTGEYDLDLPPRVDMAERLDAALFVSIHANSINLERPEVNGLETYYYNSGFKLAQTIQESILAATGMRDRGVRKARFYVLTRTSMPAVLVETGFITGAEDSANFSNPLFRMRMAEAIAQGVGNYLKVLPQ